MIPYDVEEYVENDRYMCCDAPQPEPLGPVTFSVDIAIPAAEDWERTYDEFAHMFQMPDGKSPLAKMDGGKGLTNCVPRAFSVMAAPGAGLPGPDGGIDYAAYRYTQDFAPP